MIRIQLRSACWIKKNGIWNIEKVLILILFFYKICKILTGIMNIKKKKKKVVLRFCLSKVGVREKSIYISINKFFSQKYEDVAVLKITNCLKYS